MTTMPPLILASKSPRRADLLRQMGFQFTVLSVPVDESCPEISNPVELVMTLSKRKAEAVVHKVKEGLIIGADTVVVLDNEILGKPVDEKDAARILRKLSGKTHQVYTGFSLVECAGRTISDYEETSVTFHTLSDWEIQSYIETGCPLDKAGAYGIQGRSGLFVKRIKGCFYNVVGFPLNKFYEQLKMLYPPETIADSFKKAINGNGYFY